MALTALLLAGATGALSQNSLPAPGSGGMNGMVGGVPGGPGPVIGISPGAGQPGNPGPPPPSAWGSPWYNGWNPSPTIVPSPSVSVGNFENQGTLKVIANGYDAMGVWRVLPLLVSYQFNGVNYNVTVLNAWDPWTNQWNRGVDVQAFSTNYTLRNITYNYYVVLSFGTFYFNL